MGSMQVVRGVGGSISVGDRSYTKTGMEPVVFIPAYKTLSGTVWHYWAVLGRSKGAAAGTVSTPEYTAEYNLTVNGRQVYVLTLDNGAFENGTLTISGPGTIPATIQTGAAGQWYDLASMTADNSTLQEAELLLRAAEQKRVAPRVPGGGKLVVQKLGTVGQGGSFSVKSILPDMYDKLTISNIWVEPLTAGVAANTDSNVRGDLSWTFSKSYDPGTGILNVSTMWGQLVVRRLNGGLSNMTVYAIYCK